MDRFVSNFTLRLDSKGRVSIPGSYRSVLGRDGFEGLYCYPALDRPAIDAGGNALMAEIEALIGRYRAIFGPARTVRARALRHQRDAEDRRRGAGGAEREPQASCGNYRGGGVRRSRSQVSDLGARPFPSELAEATQKVRALKGELGSQVAARDAPGARE